MEKTDARKLSTDAQQQLRYQVIRLRKQGRTHQEISEITGVARSTCSTWWSLYKTKGIKALRIKKRGRPKGSCRTLSPEQEDELRRAIVDRTPDQLKLKFALWARRAVMELVFQLWGIKMPIRTVGEYLMRWGFTPQKPIRKAYEQDPKAVKKWMDETYPDILKQAKQQGAQIHWGDETGVANNENYGRSYAPRGKTPEVRKPAKRERINMISTVTNQGKVRFMIYKETMTAAVMIRFMRRLVKDADRKVFLIVDNLKVHHSGPVKEWLEEHEKHIEVFYLPSYSPELNPDEYLNNDLKSGVHAGPSARSKEQLAKKTLSHMRRIQKKPERVKKYFKHPKIRYAA